MHWYVFNLTVKLFLSLDGKTISHQSQKKKKKKENKLSVIYSQYILKRESLKL